AGAPAAAPPAGAFPLGALLPRTRPSASVTLTKSPPGSPFLNGRAVNLILSPGLTEFDFQPARTRYAGGFISRFQTSVAPLSFITSISSQECGLAHLNCLTIPSCVTVFV